MAFIKYLYSVAIRQSYQSRPLSSVSILIFHDAVELFLQFASERHNVGRKDTKFMEYWDLLQNRMQRESFTQKESMRRLNDARRELKHNGIIPDELEIESARVNVTEFFQENTPIAFNLRFSEISLIDLVQWKEVKNKLREAENLFEEGKKEDAINNIAIGFRILIDDYEIRRRDQYGRNLFGFSRFFPITFGLKIDRELKDLFDRVFDSVKSLQNIVKILALGIDYQKFERFQSITPSIYGNPEQGYLVREFNDSRTIPTEDEFQFCINFVIESAMTLQDSRLIKNTDKD